MKKFILLILLPVIISGCTLIPQKSSQLQKSNQQLDIKNVNNEQIVDNNNINNTLNTNTPIKNDVKVDNYDMKNWVVYTNIRYGLKFLTPANWWISGSADTGKYQFLENKDWGGASGGVFISPIAKQTVNSLLADLRKKAELSRQYYKEHPDGPATKYGEPELITLDGENAIKQAYQPYEITPAGVSYFFPQRGFALDLTNLYGLGDDMEKYTNFAHDKILSSLKFLGKLDYLGFGYYSDGNNIYYNYLQALPTFPVEKISGADRFAEKNRQYFDDSMAYKVDSADIKSFTSLNVSCGMGGCIGVAKDKNNIYEGHEKHLTGYPVDIPTFQYLKYNFYKDKNALYYYGMGWGRVDFVDLATFEFIDNVYSKDKNNVYKFMDGFNIVKGADPKTFKVLSNAQESARARCIELNGIPRLELSMLYGSMQIFCSFGEEGECTQGELNAGQCFKEK